MASEAIVSSVVADMAGRLVSLVAGHLLADRRGVDDKLRRVRRLVVRIESAVEAAEARRITGRALLAWLSDLVDGAHQGRYFLDAFPVVADHDGDGNVEVAPSSFNPAKRLRVAARRLVFRDGGGVAAELDGVLADLESVSGDLTGLRLRASYFGGKALGALLRWRPDHRLWRRVLSSGAADLPCLGTGDYIAAAAGCLFPPHLNLHGVTVSRSPLRGLVGLHGSSLMTPPPTDSGRRSPELPVLLCKSVFPSYCLYYAALCTIDDTEIKQ
uniref:Disease resistance N-terminal domain-containing protein n=1 Tax=Oryza rufipogon TaxID=4529 RepID=A0A0E0NB98_ORYRU